MIMLRCNTQCMKNNLLFKPKNQDNYPEKSLILKMKEHE